MSSTIAARLQELIEKIGNKHRRNKQLEEMTGVDAERWSAFSLGRQRPTAEMLEGVSRAFPSLCLWLMTGESDASNQQYDLPTYLAMRTYKLPDILEKEPLELSDDEMRVVTVVDEQWAKYCALEGTIDPSDLTLIQEARKHGLTREQMIEKWTEDSRKLMALMIKKGKKT